MAAYALKRVLLMVPTFFAVSLVVFLVMNLAPGSPAAQALIAGDAASGQSGALAGQRRESYRRFKEVFGLDKPILLNTRFRLDRRRVREAAAEVMQLGRPVSVSRRIEAQERLEDWGWYAVPALVDLLASDPERSVRAFAARQLTFAARRPLISRSRPRLTPEERARNRETFAANESLAAWGLGEDDGPEREAEVVAFWTGWRRENAASWEWSGAAKARILLFDTRFARYWGNLLRLDFGTSHRDGRPVLQTVAGKLRYSVALGLLSVLFMYAVAVPLGVWSATHRDTLADRVLTVALFGLFSLPTFFVGVVLLGLLSRGTPFAVFPTAGFESLDAGHMTTLEHLADVAWHLVLPVFCLSVSNLAVLSRYARAGLLEVVRSDYVRTARAKGLPEVVVIWKHAARNGMIPILTLLATLLPALVGGSVVVEVVFGIPGMGLYMFESIQSRDYNAVMAILLISCALTLVGMLLSDLSYALVDPRITFGRVRS